MAKRYAAGVAASRVASHGSGANVIAGTQRARRA